MYRNLSIFVLTILFLTACSATPSPAATPTTDANAMATLVQQGIDQTLAALAPTPTTAPTSTPTAIPIVLKKLALVSNETGAWYIYTINSDSSEKNRVSNNPQVEGTFDYSPDRKYIAYETYLDDVGNSEIYRMDADGSNVTRLTTRQPNDWGPIWSPDGSKILFLSDLGNYNWEIFVMNADGSGLINLSNSTNYDVDPAWSPDGTQIAFKSGPYSDGSDTFSSDSSVTDFIKIVNADGSGKRSLPMPENVSVPGDPAWSPDGTQIAFNCSGVYSKTEGDVITPITFAGICIAAADGSSVNLVYNVETELNTTGPTYHPDPVWSPDGSKIAFVGRDTDGTTDIYTMNNSGSDIIQISNSDIEMKSIPAWSRDGKMLLFVAQQGRLLNRSFTVYIMQADGTGITKIITTTKYQSWTIWLE